MSTFMKMASTLEGKVALITGGSGGLGTAFAEALLDKGAKVCVADVNRDAGVRTERELQGRYSNQRVFFRKCDVTSEQDFRDTFKDTIEKFGKLDILCNNAGIGNEKNWRLMLDINLTAVIRGTLLAFEYMGKAAGQKNGLVVNISSAAGLLPMPFGPMYTASKHGVVGLTRSIGGHNIFFVVNGVEGADPLSSYKPPICPHPHRPMQVLSPKLHDVRVNCLCPSFTNTPILQWSEDSSYGVSPAKFADKMVSMVGVMQPREVAEMFVRLAEMEDTSGAVMLVTPSGKDILHMPMSIPEMFATHSKM